MPRPERPLDVEDGPVQQFAAQLRELRRAAGNPGYRQLARRAHFSLTTLAGAAAGKRLPSLAVTIAYVEACGGDPAEWTARWREVAAQVDATAAEASRDGPDDADPPYRGLAAYQAGDAGWYFGRDRLVAELIERVAAGRFLAVFGPSGCGKSSLLRAGLLPAAQDGRIGPADGHAWPAVVVTPGEDPLGELAAGLGEGRAGPADLDRLRTLIGHRLADRPPQAELLLVVDQFEETFTLCRDDERRETFIATVLALADDADLRVRVVIGVRADFYTACVSRPALAAALRDRQLLVTPMSATELRDAVVRPAERAGLIVEGALVSTIVAEAAGKAGGLPLASHALLEAWRRRRGNAVTLAGYEAAGGVQRALAQTAESVYAGLDADERATAREMLTRLVSLGDGSEDTRRRVSRGELDLPGVGTVLDRLAAARLVTLGLDHVELSHEALIEAWPRLRRWLAADREGLRTHRLLTEAARAWLATDRDPGSLYRGVRLAVAREWAAGTRARPGLTPLEREFLDSSVALEDRDLAVAARHSRHIRMLAAGLAVLLAVASAVGIVAVLQRRDALAAQRTAISRQLAVQALTLAESDPGTAMLLSVQALRTAPTVEARSAVLSMAAQQAYRGELTGHQGPVSDVAFAPDGRTMFSVGKDRTMRVWDTRTRRQVAVRTDHNAWLLSMAVSPDGRMLATGGDDRRVVLWDTASATPVRTLTGHTGSVTDAAFSSDGRRLATAGADSTVAVWDVAAGTRISAVPKRTRPAEQAGSAEQVVSANGVAFSPDGALLAIGYQDGSVVLWDVARGAVHLTLAGHVRSAKSVAFSPDGRLLATGGGGTTAILWDVATGTRLATFSHGRQDDVAALRFSPDGRTLATAGNDKAILLWDVEHRIQRGRLVGRGPNTYTVAFDPLAGTLASAGEAGTIIFWDPARAAVVTGDGPVNEIAFGAGGRVIATAGGTRLTVWDTVQRRPKRVHTDESGFSTVAFGPDGRTLLTAPDRPRGLMLRDPDGDFPLPGHTGVILDVAFSPDGRTAASASTDGTAMLWDVARRTRLAVLEGHTAAVNGVAFSPDGAMLATAGHDPSIMLWDVERRTRLAELTGHTGWIRTVAFSPDGRYLVSADTDRTLMLWDVRQRVGLVTLTDHEEAMHTGAAFSPDGRTLAYTSANHTVVLWDVASRRATARLSGHTQPVRAVAFSPDGHSLATAGTDESVILWGMDAAATAADICRTLARDLTPEQWGHFLPDVAYERTCTG